MAIAAGTSMEASRRSGSGFRYRDFPLEVQEKIGAHLVLEDIVIAVTASPVLLNFLAQGLRRARVQHALSIRVGQQGIASRTFNEILVFVG